MSKELIVSSGRHETRVAILEDDQVVELFHEREKEYSLAGSIHKGRVTRVLPGMQSAFVDIGLERDAFLYVSDFFEDNDEYDAVVSTVEEKVLKMEKGGAAGKPRSRAAPGQERAEPVTEAPPPVEVGGSYSARTPHACRGTPAGRRRQAGTGWPSGSRWPRSPGTTPARRSRQRPARVEVLYAGDGTSRYCGR